MNGPCYIQNRAVMNRGIKRSGCNNNNNNNNNNKIFCLNRNQRTIGPENAHLNPDLGVLSHHEMTLTLNTHTPLLTS